MASRNLKFYLKLFKQEIQTQDNQFVGMNVTKAKTQNLLGNKQ